MRLLNSIITKQLLWPIILVSCVYLLTHLLALTALPVFADESIYIRWAQLIMDEPARYLFFALNDGKTPLFIWLLVPFQFIFGNQLLAGRFLSVFVGLLQIWAMGWLAHQLGASRKTLIMTMLFTALLPFWFIHHRLALMDGLLTLWLTLSMSFVISLMNQPLRHRFPIKKLAGLGLCFALALFTKLPAILFVPVFGLWIFLPEKASIQDRLQLAIRLGLGLGFGLFLFGLLKLQPAFGQLFSRGSDFLYPWQDIFLAGQWRQTLPNFPTYISYFLSYMTSPIMLLMVIGLFLKPRQRIFHLLFWSLIVFVFPISILGRVVYPRYLLPGAIFATISAALVIQTWLERWQNHPQLGLRIFSSLFIAVLVANTAATSGVFIAQALTDANRTPYVPADQTQYLLEWSSGHGITETVALIKAASQEGTLAVATEGYFGTLPDALLMYFHRRPVEGVYLEGIGQPVSSIPTSFVTKAKEYERTWLVVNSHRLLMELPREALVAEYCRPQQAPCLQVWDITNHLSP